MKNKKNLFRILATLMSLALVLGAIIALGAVSIGATEETAETEQINETDGQERELIPVPDIPAINRPYKSIEELGIDFEKVEEYFPKNIEIRQESGKVYVKDIGAGSAIFSTSQTNDLELVNGYWTGDLDGELRRIYFYSYENYGDSKYWHVTYYADGTRDPYIVLKDKSDRSHVVL